MRDTHIQFQFVHQYDYMMNSNSILHLLYSPLPRSPPNSGQVGRWVSQAAIERIKSSANHMGGGTSSYNRTVAMLECLVGGGICIGNH